MKSTFTCTSTRQVQNHHRVGDVRSDNNDAQWLATQQESVRSFRRAQHESFVKGCEKQAAMSELHRQISVKILCAEAARYHMKNASPPADQNSLSLDEKCWWRNFCAQVALFFQVSMPTTVDTCPPSVSASQQAIENISSLGLWFAGSGISPSSRAYSVLLLSHHVLTASMQNSLQVVPATHPITDAQNIACGSTTVVDSTSLPDASPVSVTPPSSSSPPLSGYTPVYVPTVIVGLCQFTYSTFVHDARMHAQTSVLATLRSS